MIVRVALFDLFPVTCIRIKYYNYLTRSISPSFLFVSLSHIVAGHVLCKDESIFEGPQGTGLFDFLTAVTAGFEEIISKRSLHQEGVPMNRALYCY